MSNLIDNTDDNHFSMLELDLDKVAGVESTTTKTKITKAAPAVQTKPATMKQAIPTINDRINEWLTPALALINAATTREELQAAILPHKNRPATEKAFIEPALRAVEAKLRKEFLAAKAAKEALVNPPVAEAAPVAVVEVPVQDTTPALEVNASIAAVDVALAQDFAVIGSEATSNASTQALGSMATGQLRGVGFSTAEGYVGALAHGVKAATAESYKSTLRNQFHYTTEQINALTVTIIAESTLPVGAGIVHTPKGVSIFDRPKNQRTFKVGKSDASAEVKALLDTSELIAGSLIEGQPLQVSWVGGGQTTVAELSAALVKHDRKDLKVPTASDVRYASAAVSSVSNREYPSERTKGKPKTVKARWIVRHSTGASASAVVGDTAGVIVATIDLMPSGALDIKCHADHLDMQSRIQNHYDSARANEVLKSDILTGWYQMVLKHVHYGTKRGANWYVGGGFAEQVRALSAALESVWGSHDCIPVTNGPDLQRSIYKGLVEEIAGVEADYALAVEQAQERDRAKYLTDCANNDVVVTQAGADLAAKRAVVFAARANTILLDMIAVGAKFDGYQVLLGSEMIEPARKRLRALRATVEPLTEILVVELD